ncbi:Twin-arginine translocation pathway signal [Streptomyces sp. ID38640]|uniref:Twin-arginine translocation pathway signal n=1 Tax=Streptomyces sp. ID38640 TaxID=1265399 RepID=UPI00140EB362|nr:Twin-arginine translocation pathway signal [Streptomyces sp. ID38640]QIK04717.1 Twin-arginine translocation pathway signal [Streptomyces sp. ID38640]QIK10882.1 Twin-arginine translocation pathway signal [Streptomyces sp. ID38640]QIK10929.1 Twin-arginine translocation pathway signal [Streptomyces sp. ID38640]
MHCQRQGRSTERTVTAIRNALPEVTALEAWRLALGWSRADTVAQISDLYRADGLIPPGPSQSMLCRWEHHPHDWPGQEYTAMLCRAYGARPVQLGLSRAGGDAFDGLGLGAKIRYGRADAEACEAPARERVVAMTTSTGLPAVRESLHLALLADPAGSSAVAELAEAAVEHYALNYSKHPPHTLFTEVRTARNLLTEALTTHTIEETVAAEMRRSIGWLSALLGNLAFHLDDTSGARAHLTTAGTYGTRTADARLTAWACGAQSMVARATGQYARALTHAEQGLIHAPAGLARAQLHAWAQLPALAGQGRADEADAALAAAGRELEADTVGEAPGRFGFDAAEYALHEAEAHLSLGRTEQATARAEVSASHVPAGTPGWAASTLVLAQAEAALRPADAAQRALDVLERVPTARLRSTSRARLVRLDTALATTPAAGVDDLHERVRSLLPAINDHGDATSA